MATYTELFSIRNDPDLKEKVTVSTWIKAQELLDATPTAAEVTWASETLENPSERADQIMNYVLAANKAKTLAQIQAATDTAIQTNVDAAVDALIAGGS